MSNAIIYYGAPITSSQQTVSESLRLRGINLIKTSVRSIRPDGISFINSPSYDLYKENLHLAIWSAYKAEPIAMTIEHKYRAFPTKTNLEGFSRLNVVWSYEDAQPPPDAAAIDAMKAKYNPSDLKIHNKPCFLAEVSLSSLTELSDAGANETIPTVTGAINLSAAYALIKLQRLALAFLKTHQYSLANGNDQADVFQRLFRLSDGQKSSKATMDYDGSGMAVEKTLWDLGKKSDTDYVFHVNGITPPDQYNPYVGSVNSLPNNDGFLFPYVEELAKEDDGTVPEIIAQYFLTSLADDKETAISVMEELRAGWGVIKKTEYGDILSHIYSGIKLAIDTGAAIKLLWGSKYGGFALQGTGFALYKGGNLMDPAPFADLQAAFDTALPGGKALESIIDLLTMTPAQRVDAKGANRPSSIHELRSMIMRHGYNINNEQGIRSHALHLSFPTLPYLIINAHNIAAILKAMTQPATNDHNYPLHPLYLLSSVRNHRLLSAFGDHAPTFLIPGGRVLNLESSSFSFTEKARAGKAKVVHNVARMHVQIVPLAKAMADLDTVFRTKDVHSPIGTPLAKKASTLSVYREFTDNAATEVLAALRTAAGVTINVTTPGNPLKRGAGGDGAGGPSKKANLKRNMRDI